MNRTDVEPLGGRVGTASVSMLLLAACAFAACFACQSRDALTGFPLDDAWIHLVYARNLISGHGLAYNAGVLETGLTAPLWTLLIAPWAALADQAPIAIKCVGLGLHVTTAWLAARTLLALKVTRSIAIATAFAIVLEPWSMLAALSGMEVPLTSALLIVSIFALATERTALALVVMSWLPLARPESLLVVLALSVVLLRAHWSSSRASMRAALVLVPWLGWIAWCVYCKSVTGYALSNTFYAKAAPSPATWLHNLVALWSMLKAMLLLVVVGGMLGVTLGRRLRDTSDEADARNRVYRWVGMSVLAFVVAVLLGQSLREVNTLYWLRYVLPVLPLLLMMPAIVVHDGLPRIRALSRAWRIVALVALALVMLRWPLLTPRATDHYAQSCTNIREMHVAVAAWLRQHTHEGEAVATNDAGAIAYFSQRPVLDLLGLNNHRVVHGQLAAEIERMSPRYFAIFPAWFPKIANSPRFKRAFSVKAERYVISSGPQSELVVYERL